MAGGNLRASQHTAAQKIAAVRLWQTGMPIELVAASSGAAARTIQYWAERMEIGKLQAPDKEIRDEARILAARVCVPDGVEIPQINYEALTTPAVPQVAVLQPAPSAWGGEEPRTHARKPDLDGAQLAAHASNPTLDKQDALPTQGAPLEPPLSSADAQMVAGMVAGLLGADEDARALDPAPSDLTPDVQQTASAFGSLAVWNLVALGRVMSGTQRIPAWQFQQFKLAASIWSQLANLAAPKPKAVAYVPPVAAHAAAPQRGEILMALNELVDKVDNDKELAVLEGLIRKVASGEVSVGAAPEPVQ